jgi:hypothetical protein
MFGVTHVTSFEAVSILGVVWLGAVTCEEPKFYASVGDVKGRETLALSHSAKWS